MNSTEPIPIQIKARRDGFILVPDAEAPFESIMAYMEQRLNESHDFFTRSEMTLDLRARPLRSDEILALRSLLVEKARVDLMEVRLADEISFFVEPGAARAAPPPRAQISCGQESSPMIVRNTCRSGIRIESPSDCVVLGDVNPGAEVIAIGDVIVFGSLRGIAHAGASGDRSARIWALSIEPSQIRIADLAALPPRGSKLAPKRFEIAEIRKDMIQVITV